MQFTTGKQIGFRINETLSNSFTTLYEKNKNLLPAGATIKDYFEMLGNQALASENNNDNTLITENETLKTMLLQSENKIEALEKQANNNAEIATRLQLENDKLLENQLITSENNNENKLFSDDNRYKLWCLLQIFKQQKPDITFENMITSIISSYEQNGYLKLDNSDLQHIENIKSQYNGTIQ